MTLAENLPSPTETISRCELTIEGLTESVILRYFESLNAGEFEATAALFAETGVMYPPFEEGVTGADAIALYLEQEAQGLKASPREAIAELLEDGEMEVKVAGKVETRWFGVNVAWRFVLNADKEILSVKIKLLASPQELLSMRR